MSAQLQIVASGLSSFLQAPVRVATPEDESSRGLQLSVRTLFQATQYLYIPTTSAVPQTIGDGNFNVTVTYLTGESVTISVHPGDTIGAVKDRIESVSRIPADEMRLMFVGKQLDDGQTVADYGIVADCTLHLVRRLRGGGLRRIYQINPGEFEPKYDYDFTNVVDDGKKYTRGGYEYNRPYGWMRQAVKTKGVYKDDDWLGSNGIRTRATRGEWPVAYHGTKMGNIDSILKTGFVAGPRELYGKGVYTSPSIKMVAEKYSPPFEHTDGKNYKIIFQVRVNPAEGHLEVIRKWRTMNGADYWLSSKQDIERGQVDVRPYGILTCEHPSPPPPTRSGRSCLVL